MGKIEKILRKLQSLDEKLDEKQKNLREVAGHLFSKGVIRDVKKTIKEVQKELKPENEKTFKLGLDLHGVSDKAPEFFSLISKLLVDHGHEVHIMTGEHKGKKLDEQIKKSNIHFTHIFSIADWHKERNTPMNYDSDGNPWMDSQIWDASKADYAKEENIDLVIDDTARYGAYFTDCIFMATDIQLPGDKAQKWIQHRRKGMKDAAKNKTWIRKNRDLHKEGYPNVVGVIMEKVGEELSFQDIVDITYEKGVDLYRVIHKKYYLTGGKFVYHMFLTEPFFEENDWKKCILKLGEENDRRMWLPK